MDRLNASEFVEVAQALVAPYAGSDGRPTKRFCFDFQDRFSGQNHIRSFFNVGYGAGEFFSAMDNRGFNCSDQFSQFGTVMFDQSYLIQLFPGAAHWGFCSCHIDSLHSMEGANDAETVRRTTLVLPR